MRRFAGSCRFGHNKALAMQKERHRAGRKEARLRRAVHGAHGVAQQHRDRMAGGCACPSATADIERPERAYTNFFAKRAAFPRFSKKELSESFHYPNPKQITLDQANNRPFLPRLGWLRSNDQWQSCLVNGLIQFCTIRRAILAMASRATMQMRTHSAVCTAQLDFLLGSVTAK